MYSYTSIVEPALGAGFAIPYATMNVMAHSDNIAPSHATPILTTDTQTGLPTLLRFYGELDELVRAGKNLSLIICYLDAPIPGATSSTDDSALAVARLAAEAALSYPAAQIYRTAEDSFALVLPETMRAEALRLAEAVRRRVERSGGSTVSLAVASAPHDAAEAGALIAVCEIPLIARAARNCVIAATPVESLAPATARLMNVLIARVVALVALSQQLGETERQALHDPVSGLPNGRSLERTLPRFIERSMHTGSPLALLLIDGDSLKEFNTVHGYDAGNNWIRSITAALTSHLRPADYIARWFVGDEFVVLLPETTATQALEIAERLRLAVERSGQLLSGVGTISIGVAPLSEATATAEALLAAARNALLRAKKQGKNRVTLAE
jgi:diguanylate cyclase (GGDEF)-like protein